MPEEPEKELASLEDDTAEDQADGFSETELDENELPISDSPVEIAPEEITPGETITSEDEVADKGHLTELVCDSCLELNLVTKSCIKCSACGAAFCLHFASTIDAQYCVNCMSEISITKQVVTKTYEHQSSETGEKTFYRRRAREIKIEGLDWLFAQRKIIDLSDIELDLSIEYHRNILGLLITEQEKRKNEKMHRYANVVFKLPKNHTTKVLDSTTTTVKKTRTISKDKASEQLAALMKSMLAKGVTPDQLAAMLKR